MQQALASLNDRLAPVEEIFFTWLLRVVMAGTLAGCAWIDDAPPLDIAATLIAAYVALRVVSQFGALSSAAPFENRALSSAFALFAIATLGLSLMAVVTFIERVSLFVVR